MRHRLRHLILAPALAAVATAALALATPLAPAAFAQETPSDTLLTVDHYLDWEGVADPQISPDGRQIIYTRRWVDKVQDRWRSALWIMEADGSRNRFLVEGSSARWSPDGTRILYLAPGEPKGTQIFVRWMDAEGATTQVTRLTETPVNVKWSPDGRSISFVMRVPPAPKSDWRIDLPAAPPGATWTPAPRIIERMHFRQDRVGFQPEGWNHLFIVPADGGTPRQITEGEWHVGARFSGMDFGAGYDWTPDGRTIVFDGLTEDPDMRFAESAIHAVDVETREIRKLTDRKGNWTGPVVSPDGRYVLFTGTDKTDQTYHVAEIHVVGIDGRGMRKVTPDLDRDVSGLTWAPDSRGFYFAVDDRGTRNVYHATLDGRVRKLTDGVHMLTLSSISRNGTAVGVRTAPHEPGDVVAFDVRRPGEIRQLTHVNDDVLAGIRLGEVEEIWYESTGGARIQGWIVKPPSFDPSKKYPLILEIHGGPHAMYNVGFNYMFQNFAANGYVVLYTNPRGSTGYGTAFGNAIDDAYPSVDYDDLMAGVDAVVARGYIDTDRMYVGGCSGGGVLSSWVIGHTDRFAAAAVRCPVVNWFSFAGTADIVYWSYKRFRSLPWENPEKWLAHSPIMYAKNVKTPTLLMTGELDLRTPMSQTEEYYQALKMLGVPVAMMRFNDEYHGTSSRPSNFMRTQLYMLKWYGRWTKGGPVTAAQ